MYNNIFYLYTLRDNVVIDIQRMRYNNCDFGPTVFNEPGEIEFCVMAINESSNQIKTSSRLKLMIYEGINEEFVLPVYPTIYLCRGCATSVQFDFSDFNFYNGKVELTIKRKPNTSTLFTYEFTSRNLSTVFLSSDFTSGLNYSDYVYDLVWVFDEDRYPLCVPSKIKVQEMVNNG